MINKVEVPKVDIIITNTPKKYENMVEEIVPSFLKLLKELTLLEEEIYMRNRKMDVEKTILNIPANQIHPRWQELMIEYKNRFKGIVEGKVSEKLLSEGYAEKYSNPSEYFYLKDEESLLEFSMGKEDRATIIIRYKDTIDMKHKFTFRLIDEKWLVDEKYYGFEDEEIWFVDRI